MFTQFCPRCFSHFYDPDKYAAHIKTCGLVKQQPEIVKETKAVKEEPPEKPLAMKEKIISEVEKEKKPVEKAVPAADNAKSDLLAKQAAFAKPPKQQPFKV